MVRRPKSGTVTIGARCVHCGSPRAFGDWRHPLVTDYVRRYECTGTLDERDGTAPVACECVATQEHSGSISLDCLSPPDMPIPARWMNAIFGRRLDATMFKGHLRNGLPIQAEGTLLGHAGGWNSERGTRATFGLTGNSRLTVGQPDNAAEWRFVTVNLVFSVPVRPPDANKQSLPLMLDGVPVKIEQVVDYDEATRRLPGRHSVHVTAEVIVPRSVAFDAAQDLVGDLCSVLSLAQGTLVNWIFCEQRDAAGQAVFAVHHPAVTRGYSGALPLIDPRSPKEMPTFVEAVFGRFRELKTSYQLPVVSRACSDVRTTGFLETRCLQLLSIMEFVIGRNAVFGGQEFIMDDRQFQKRLGALKRAISELLCLAFPELGKQKANRMTEHLRGLNFTTFRRRLRGAATSFGVHLDNEQVEAIAATRNELVHRAAFATDDEMKEFQRVQSVLDRLLLGLLGYRGPYIDASTFERAKSD
jgi:hypothetical protein